jgi:hypothetical protein
MAQQYASNVPISRPAVLPNFPPDVDLNGIGFNYDIGLMYQVYQETPLIRLPPPGSGGGQ